MSGLISLVYISTARTIMSEEDLLELLNKTHRNNAEYDVTGLLLYRDGTFIQALEGKRQTVEKLYDVIKRDSRHYGVTLISKRPITQREFGQWRMAFIQLDNHDFSDIEGYTDFLQNQESVKEFINNPGKLYQLMMMFRSRLTG